MKQFIIIATMFAFSACRNNNNDIPRTYIPDYGDCKCSSLLPNNESIDRNHRATYNHLGKYDNVITIPAYGFESYSRNMPGRRNRLPFNYDDFITEKKDANAELAECGVDSFNYIFFKTPDYIQMIEELLDNDLFKLDTLNFGNNGRVMTSFTTQGNFVEIEMHNDNGRNYKYSLDLNTAHSYAATDRVISNVNNCLHENYFFTIKIPCDLEINNNGNITNHRLNEGFHIVVRPDVETYENEIVYEIVLTTKEFRSRLFKNVTLKLTANELTNSQGCPSIDFSTKEEVYNY
jgi:hypothetical protein